MSASLQLVVARFSDSDRAEQARSILASRGIASALLVKRTMLRRVLGKGDEYVVGVAAADAERARLALRSPS